MATKVSPEFRVLALGSTGPNSGANTQENFGFRDNFLAIVKRDRGDSGPQQAIVSTEVVGSRNNPSIAVPWANQPNFESIDDSLEFVAFGGGKVWFGADSVAVDAKAEEPLVAGFTVKARAVGVNCIARGDIGKAPGGAAGAKTLHFKQKKPSLDDRLVIQTVKPFYRDTTCVQIREALPDRTVEFESEEKLEANQQIKVEIFWIGLAPGQTQKAGARFAFAGNQWSVAFRQDSQNWVLPSLDRMVSGQWSTVRKYEAARFKEFTGTTICTVRRMGGRIVVSLSTGDSTHSFETLLSRSSASRATPGTPLENELVTANWRNGKVNLTSLGVRLRVGLELLEHTSTDGKDSHGDFTRKIARSLKTSGFALDEIGGAPSNGTVKIFPGGWRSSAAKIKKRAVLDHTGLTYTLRLQASKHESPFVMTVLGRFAGTETEGDDTPLDVTTAFLNGSIDAASPEAQVSGTILNLNFSRNLLKTIGEEQGVEWKEWLKQFRLVSFEVRWLLSDDSHSEWDSIGDYYIEDDDYDNPGANTWTLKLSCHDEIMRTLAPHSTVDYRYIYDLVQLLLEKNDGQGADLFGGDCIKYILGVELGASYAERLNGNGDPLRYFPVDHYPLLSSRAGGVGYLQIGGGDTGPPTFNKVVMPPPRWNCSAHDWMQHIAESDYGSLFSAPVPGGDGRPCPIYANIDEWQKNSPTWTLADDNYEAGDLDFIIKTMRAARKGGVNYNAVQALWNPVGGNQVPFQAVRVAEGRLPADDPNAQEHSWRRTYVQERVVWWNPEATRSWVQQFLGGLEGVDIRWPTITLTRGDARIWWGHKVQIKSHNDGTGEGKAGCFSDPDLNLENILFRVLKVRHNFVKDKFGIDMFTTEVQLFPLLNNEE